MTSKPDHDYRLIPAMALIKTHRTTLDYGTRTLHPHSDHMDYSCLPSCHLLMRCSYESVNENLYRYL